jgi:hypothetical protein
VGVDAAETEKLFRVTFNIQIFPLIEIKYLVVRVDAIYRVTLYFTQKPNMV